MTDSKGPKRCTAFKGTEILADGRLLDVALKVKALTEHTPDVSVLTFDDSTGQIIDLDLHGTLHEISDRYSPSKETSDYPLGDDKEPDNGRGRGRPRLGVVSREVTLLPRHWEWLSAQSGGASQALRRLVDEARKKDGGRTNKRERIEAAYSFMSSMAGNMTGFEEATRALFSGDRDRFEDIASQWPEDVARYVGKLAWSTER